MRVEDLHLQPVADDVARRLVARFGDLIVFERGLASPSEQWAAMAKNVAGPPLRRDWIRRTYLASPVVNAMGTAVESPALANDAGRDAIAATLAAVAARFSLAALEEAFPHCRGDAFDLRPILARHGLYVAAWLKAEARAKGGRFLMKEGSLDRWHWNAPFVPQGVMAPPSVLP